MARHPEHPDHAAHRPQPRRRQRAVDDRNSNLWISTDWAEIVRYDTRSGTFSMAPATLPELAHHVAWNIQIDDWSRPNPIVYFAMRSFTDAQGTLHPGGVVAYGGK